MKYKDYYKILGLETSRVSIEEIKSAYRTSAKKYHPDLNVGDNLAEERIKDINEAYRVLSTPSSKRKYDRVWNSRNNAKNYQNFKGKNIFSMFLGDIDRTEKEEKNTEIENLSVFVMQMINRAIKAYIEKDYNLAKEVIADDDYVDEKYLEIIGNLRNKENIDKDYLSFAIYTTLVVKYLERIADHSVNIAEWVVYISSGYYKDKMIF